VLWGATQYGGANSSGTLFSFDPATSVYTDVFDFPTTIFGPGFSASGVRIPLLAAADGNLYGVAYDEASGLRTVFQYSPSGNSVSDSEAWDTPFPSSLRPWPAEFWELWIGPPS
jgi:uncharacterized repeat protein (TIGR03803 family)